MNKPILQTIFFFLLFLGMHACVPTDTSNYNPNEKIFCDITTQLNGNDNSLKSELRFYVKDSLDSRPYFLEAPVLVNGMEMDKKFVSHKGIYYTSTYRMNHVKDIIFSFTNLDDQKHEINVPLSNIPKLSKDHFSAKEIMNLQIDNNESYIVIDSNNKIFEIPNTRNSREHISLGDAQLIQIIKEENTILLKDKLWVKYNSKSLSHSQSIKVVKPSIEIVE